MSADCVNSSSVITLKNIIDNYPRIHFDSYIWTLDKPTASLSAAI